MRLPALMVLLAASPALAVPSHQAEEKAVEGDKLRDRGDSKGAKAAYEEALRIDSRYAPALSGLGSVLFEAGDVPGALTHFKQATEADGTYALAFYNLGFAYRKAGAFLDAITAYRTYVKLRPDDPDGFFGMAESLREVGMRAEAIAAYKEYANREKRSTEREYVAKAVKTAADLEEREKQSVGYPGAPVIPRGGDQRAAFQKMSDGDRWMSARQTRQALFAYEDALAAAPDSPDALYRVGLAAASMGHLALAASAWERVSKDGKASPALQASARTNLEKARARMAAAPAAPSTPVVTTAPVSAPAPGASADAMANSIYDRAVAAYRAQRYDEAAGLFGQALGQKPDMTYALVGRANARVALGQLDQASVDLEQAIRTAPGSAAPLYSLGVVYERMGQRRKAVDAYQRYATSSASDADPGLRATAAGKVRELSQ